MGSLSLQEQFVAVTCQALSIPTLFDDCHRENHSISFLHESAESTHFMSARIIDGKAIAQEIRKSLASEVTEYSQQTGVVPHLIAVLVGDDPASAVYVRNKQKACDQVGMKSTLFRLPAHTTQKELLDLIHQFNDDAGVHGILVQLPLPAQIEELAVLDAVTPLKDVDAFHPENVGLIVQGRPRFLPCTPYGVQQLLVASGTNIEGAHAVILGRSEIVGKPLASLLVQKGAAANATVTVCHSRTKNLPELTRTADILIAAIGSPEFVKAHMVKPGAVVIDVGTNRVGDKKLVGDVAFDEVSQIASAITPVPGGVGPMTITMLLKNTLAAAKLTHQTKVERQE
jgi:methylenetetrahydrofolate dehydrogenase (NADP+)/methenyltetrahydrofolate cyclohydrolase